MLIFSFVLFYFHFVFFLSFTTFNEFLFAVLKICLNNEFSWFFFFFLVFIFFFNYNKFHSLIFFVLFVVKIVFSRNVMLK